MSDGIRENQIARAKNLALTCRELSKLIETLERQGADIARRLDDARARRVRVEAEIETLIGDSPFLPSEGR